MEKDTCIVVSLRALAPSLTRVTVAGAIGGVLHVGHGDCDSIDAIVVELVQNMCAPTK
jgi:fructose-1,6-bisphosphatase/sedoheptulose 1,7-bisphosphatase-like protein